MTCKDCLHDGVCYMQEACNDIQAWVNAALCEDFKDKSNFAEVKHGQNLNVKYAECDEFRCSECGIHLKDWCECTDEDDNVWSEYVFKYCPNCGAKIDELR